MDKLLEAGRCLAARDGRPAARALLRGLGYSATIAIAGCVQEEQPGTCVKKATGERLIATPFYDADGIRYWTARDANDLEIIIDRDNSDQWSCRARTIQGSSTE